MDSTPVSLLEQLKKPQQQAAWNRFAVKICWHTFGCNRYSRLFIRCSASRWRDSQRCRSSFRQARDAPGSVSALPPSPGEIPWHR
jgi:hypothetical protein